MTSPFQTELRDRAAAHAREWEDARDPSVGLVEVEAAVRRRRRGRGLLAVAGSVAGVAVVAGAAYGVLGGSSLIAGPHGSGQVFGALAGVGKDGVVLSVPEEAPNPGYGSKYRVVILDAAGKHATTLSSAAVSAALGSAADGWPVVTLVGLDSRLDRAVFTLDNPMGLVTTRVALVDLDSGDVRVVDPCTSSLDSIDLSQWCGSPTASGGALVIDPETGNAIQLTAYEACESANARFGDQIVAMCGEVGYSSYLVTLDPDTGQVVDQASLGEAPLQMPMVVGGSLYLNTYTKDGESVLVNDDMVGPDVGGAPIVGLGVMGDRLLVQTGAGDHTPPSTYGQSVGLWSPSTGEYVKLYSLNDVEATSVTVVPVSY